MVAIRLRFPLLLAFWVAYTPIVAAPFDRAAAVQQIELRLNAFDRHEAASYALWKRGLEGENVKQEVATLGAWPRLDDLNGTALRVLDSDATDAGGLKAIRVLLGARAISSTRAQGLLLQYHLNRPEVLRAIAELNLDAGAGLPFWKHVYATSSSREVRGNAAAWLLDEALREVNRGGPSRRQFASYAKLIREQYADVRCGPSLRIPRYMDRSASLRELVDNREMILSHSVAVTLPGIEVATVTGGTDSLARYRGKVVLIDFWATWCGACKANHPELVALKKRLAGKPFEIVGISVDDTSAAVIRYMKQHPLPWVQWHVGPQAPLLKEWGVQGFPTYLLVDTRGVVRLRGDGELLGVIEDSIPKWMAGAADSPIEGSSNL